MDDFRVGSISPYDPDRRHELSGAVKRRREKRVEDQESEAEAGEEPAGDYYEPSSP